jgi:hypothetical protein
MNRGDIRTAVLRQSEYDPQTNEWTAWLNGLIDDAYAEIMAEATWPFAVRVARLTARRDKGTVLAMADLSVTLGAVSVLGGFFSRNDEYQFIELDGHEYQIVEVDIAGTAWLGEGVYAASAAYNYEIRHRDYLLPMDVAEVLSVEFRNAPRDGTSGNGKSPGIPNQYDARLNLDLTSTAETPDCYFPVEDHTLPTPEAAPVLEAVAGTPGVPNRTHYFAWCYEIGDPDDRHWSAPSAVASITTAGSQDVVVTVPATATGHRKRLLWAELEDDATYTFYPCCGAAGWSSTHADYELMSVQTVWTLDSEYQEKRAAPRIEAHGNTIKRIRFWPRVHDTAGAAQVAGADLDEKFFWVRYLASPSLLRKDSDAPVVPREHRRAIVDRVLVDVFMRLKDNTSADNHQLKYRERLRLMRNRYGSQRDVSVKRRGRWSRNVDPSDWDIRIGSVTSS